MRVYTFVFTINGKKIAKENFAIEDQPSDYFSFGQSYKAD